MVHIDSVLFLDCIMSKIVKINFFKVFLPIYRLSDHLLTYDENKVHFIRNLQFRIKKFFFASGKLQKE